MSKENLKRFLEKVSTDQTLAETVITLAKQNGFELTADDFHFEEQAMANDRVTRATGRNFPITVHYHKSSDDKVVCIYKPRES